MSALRAVVLAGGYGTRMRPLSERRPKHLLPLDGDTVIGAQLRSLARAGVRDVVLATAYHAEAFRPALGDGQAHGVRLHYAREDEPLGTGGALRHALATLDGPDFAERGDPVVVLNGDLVTGHDIAAQAWAHSVSGADVTLHVRHVDDARPYGLVTLDGDRVTAFEEKPARSAPGFVNAGTYVVTPRVLADVPAETVVSLEREVFPAAVAAGQVRGHREDAHFADIGTPWALLAENLRRAAARGESAVVLSDGVHPTAHVTDTLVMPGARVGARAVVTGCVLGPGSSVGANARLTRCVLGDDAAVAAGAHLTDTVLDLDEHR